MKFIRQKKWVLPAVIIIVIPFLVLINTLLVYALVFVRNMFSHSGDNQQPFTLKFLIQDVINYWLIFLILFLIEFSVLLSYFMIHKYKIYRETHNKSRFLRDSKNKVYGSAAWLTPTEIANTFPLSKTVENDYGIVVQTTKTKIGGVQFNIKSDAHNIVIGGTGSGKTQKLVIPTIYLNAQSKIKPSMVITDPKGELFQNHSKILKDNGYDVYVINLRDTSVSNSWNPFVKVYDFYVESMRLKKENNPLNESITYESMALSWINDIVEALFPESDPKQKFWNQSAMQVVKSIMLFMLEQLEDQPDVPLKYFSMSNAAIVATNRQRYVEILKKMPTHSLARQIGLGVLEGAEETAGSISQMVANGLRLFTDPVTRNISCSNDINLDEIVKKPSAVFLVVPDESNERNAFVSMFIAQLYKNTIRYASTLPDIKLPRPLYFLFDEFGNIPTIASMAQMITVARSRNIFFMMIMQDLQQLTQKYGKETAETIFNNCILHTFLQTMDLQTANKYSDMFGEKTIINYSHSCNKDKKADNINSSLQGKKLITGSELMKLDFDTAVIFLAKHNPAKTRLIPFYEWGSKPEGQATVTNASRLIDFNKDYYLSYIGLFYYIEKRKNPQAAAEREKSEK